MWPCDLDLLTLKLGHKSRTLCWSWTQTRQNFSKLVRGLVKFSSVVNVCQFRLAPKLFFKATWSVFWELQSDLSIWTLTLLVFAHRASTCSAIFDESDDHSTRTLPRLLYMSLFCRMWTTAMACWPGLQTTWPTSYTECSSATCFGSCKFGWGLSSLPHSDLQLQAARYLQRCLQEKAQGTWSTVAHQFRKSAAVDNCAQPVDNSITPHRVTALPAEHVRGVGPFRSSVLLRATQPIISTIHEFWQF